MDEGEFIFVMMLGTIFGIMLTLVSQRYMRRKIRKAMENEALSPTRKTDLLVTENESMRGQMSRLEERLAVMERITTDNHMSLNQELERLR